MDDFSKRADLNTLAELFQLTSDADKAAAFMRFSAPQRAAYLTTLRAAARDETITSRKRAALWHVERLLTGLDGQMWAAKR
jgi:hypothetical protein